MALAISTSWNAHRFDDGEKLLFEINQLGFKAIELSFNLNSEMVDEIADSARRLKISIESLHNYCPTPDGLSRKQSLPDCYSLSSLDITERSLAVKYTKRSIDTASRLGAKVVVLHCGRVEIPDYTRQLINIYNQGENNSPGFLELKEKMIRGREFEAGKFLAQALISIDELNTYARLKDVFLGIETRFYYREIPTIDEIGVILDKFINTQVCYWHDTGHAQLMENLGLATHKNFLERYGRRLIGVHLHDIQGCQDHLAPSQGKIDFAMLKPYLKENTLKVIEAHHPATAEELIKSRNFISRVYDKPM
ncbi:MAG: sugar phosphate isomerase/epimerase [Candidatus Omnitrophica bacterium]|nr:sugar phosphate isomerase/epimerase [Candidatus Omnitrophota bacterium]MBU1924006.1 sugar phosphate isomerase/epimerase [Candidatus Omnitrophota bacterium]